MRSTRWSQHQPYKLVWRSSYQLQGQPINNGNKEVLEHEVNWYSRPNNWEVMSQVVMQVVQHITSPIRLSRNNISEIGRTCIERKNNLQSIKHRTQIMEEKYFCILAYISMRLITMGLSHKQKMWPGRAIHRWNNQPSLTVGRSCSSAMEILQTVDLYKMAIYWFI